MRKPSNPKERNLLKGAMRRVFSRSELRKEALAKNTIKHQDHDRPRVTKWVFCDECGWIFPSYLAQVDHKQPVIPVNQTLEDLSWDELIDRLWCDPKNLSVMDKDCHKAKSKLENQERRRIRGTKKDKS